MAARRSASVMALGAAVAAISACDQLFDIEQRAALVDGGTDGSADSSVDSGGDTGAVDSSAGPQDSGNVDVVTTDSSPVEAGPADTSTSDSSPPADGPATDGPPSDAVPPDGPTCPTLYVSSLNGLDGNTGCSPSAAKLTVTDAIATATASGGTVTTIEVCAGGYPSPTNDSLVLSVPVSLLGGFDCNTWQQTGAPTTLSYATGEQGPTLTVTGSKVSSSTRIDGFTIEGPGGASAQTGAAVLVTLGSQPTLSNDKLVGGSTSYTLTTSNDPTPATAGMVVTNQGAPTLSNDVLQGGSGQTGAGAGNGSVGLYADGTNGDISITGCTIQGGTGIANGATGTGSSGIVIETGGTASPTYTIQNNVIVAGSGQGTSRSTRGVYVDSGGSVTVNLVSNVIDGGDEVNNSGGATVGSECPKGAEFTAAGTVTATGNRVFGGSCNLTSPGNSASLYGMLVNGGSTFMAVNNMVAMGTSTLSHGGAALALSTLAGPVVLHNTLVTGPAGSAPLGALWVESNTTNAVIENNILAASGGAPEAAGLLVSCTGDAGAGALQSFQNNLVFATTGGLMRWENCYSEASYPTVPAMNAELVTLGATAANNLTVQSSCPTDAGAGSGCATVTACTTQQACIQAIFQGFDTASNGYANLFNLTAVVVGCPGLAPPSGVGWPIAPTPPCLLARSTLDDSSQVPLDLYGNCRSTTAPTMGAAEYTGTCQ